MPLQTLFTELTPDLCLSQQGPPKFSCCNILRFLMHTLFRLRPVENLNSPMGIAGNMLLLGLKAQVISSHHIFRYQSIIVYYSAKTFLANVLCSFSFFNYHNLIEARFMKLSSK